MEEGFIRSQPIRITPLYVFVCHRCDKEFGSREKNPVMCGKCKTALWWRPRKIKA